LRKFDRKNSQGVVSLPPPPFFFEKKMEDCNFGHFRNTGWQRVRGSVDETKQNKKTQTKRVVFYTGDLKCGAIKKEVYTQCQRVFPLGIHEKAFS